MKISFILFSFIAAALAQGCYEDNCARRVTGTWPGIGLPVESRVSLCNDFVFATVSPLPTTITTTVSRYTTKLPPMSAVTTLTTYINATRPQNTTIVPTAIPTYVDGYCTDMEQFSSACSCWAEVTPQTTNLPTPTVTVTTTRWYNVACSPAATAVSSSERFPCSAQWGMCSCLRSGDQDVCVRVGRFPDDLVNGMRNATGPCAMNKECGVNDECDPGSICVYDGSCACGKKRCYRAAPDGCGYQGLPIESEDDGRKML